MEENNLGQQVNAQQPVYQPQVPAEPPKKKSKVGLIIGIIVVLVLALAVAGFFLFKDAFASPKQKVAKGFEKLHEEMAERPHPVLDDLGMEELGQYYTENSVDFTSKVNVKLEEMEEEMFDTFGFDIDVKNDLKEKKTALSIGASIANVDLLQLDTIFADNVLYLALPGLLEGDYSFDFDNAIDFLKGLGMGEEEIAEYEKIIAQAGSSTIDEELYLQFEEGLNEICDRYQKEFEKTTKYTKKKDVIEITISKDTIQECFRELAEYILTSDLMGEVYAQMEEAGEEVDLEEAIKEIKEGDESLFENDLTFAVTLDKKGRIVALATVEDIELSGYEDVGIGFEFQFKGDKYVTDDMEGSIVVSYKEDGEKQTTEIDMECTTEEQNDTFHESMQLKLEQKGETVGKLKCETEWNVKDKEFTNKLVLTAAGQKLFDLSTTGALTDVKKGQSFTLDIAKLEVKSMGQTLVTVSGSIGIKPLEEEIKLPYDAEEITEMSEMDLYGLIMEIGTNMQQFEDLLDY